VYSRSSILDTIIQVETFTSLASLKDVWPLNFARD
jgi:hypothetical protein